MSSLKNLIIIVGILIFANITNFAFQTVTGAVSGQVIDPNQIPLEGVLIRIIRLDNGFDYGTQTNSQGSYSFEFLPAGMYKITAEKVGYYPASIPQYTIEVNREKIIKPPPFQMQPIGVSYTAPPIPTSDEEIVQASLTDATLRGNITSKFLQSLPLPNMRSFDNLALLLPGIIPSPRASTLINTGITSGIATAGQFSANGQRTRSNNFTIDGSDNNDQEIGIRRQGFTALVPQRLESIAEFQSSSLLADAESGRNTGAQINVVSRFGENKFFGEVSNFFTDSSLNARDFFDQKGTDNPKKNPFTRNQFGLNIGIPILKDRLQSFISFEKQILNREQEYHFSVPTKVTRDQSINFSQKENSLGNAIFDPLFYPLPNNLEGPYGENTFTQLLPSSGRGNIFNLKLDYKPQSFNKISSISARYNLTDDTTQLPSIDNAINATLTALSKTQNLAFTINSELSKNISNQIRFSYGRTAIRFQEYSTSPLIFNSSHTYNVNGINKKATTGPIGRLIVHPFSSIGVDPYNFPQKRANNTFQIANTTIINKGKNTIKFGLDIRRVQLNSQLDRNYRVQMAFTPSLIRVGEKISVSPTDLVALELPSAISQTLAVVPDSTLALRFTETNFFINEQLQLYPRLTLEIGLRYERNTVPVDATGRLEKSFKIKNSDLPPFDPASGYGDVFIKSFEAQREILDGRKKIYEGDNNNFAGRVSFALDLTGDGRTSLRGGYGLFYDPILGTVVSQSHNAFPNFIPVNFGSSVLLPNNLIANPALIRFGTNPEVPVIRPGTINTIGFSPDQFITGVGELLALNGFGAGFGASITLPDKKLRTPYAHQYSLGFEKILFDHYTFSVAYAGTSGHKFIRIRTPNGGQFTPISLIKISEDTGFVITRLLKRTNPDLGPVSIFESSANSSYNSLQFSLNRQPSNGLACQISYTYSHAIDDVSDIFDLSGSSALAQDEMHQREGLKIEKGSADFDVRHRFTAAWQYTIPFQNRMKFLRDLQLSGILTLQTGQPFTVISSLDTNFDGNPNDRLNTTQGLIFPNDKRVKIILPSNTNSIGLLAPLDSKTPYNGAIGRNTFRASGIASVDLALSREFKIGNYHSITARVEGFNIFNRTHFGTPVRVLEAPSFGSSVNTSIPARMIQLAVHYSF